MTPQEKEILQSLISMNERGELDRASFDDITDPRLPPPNVPGNFIHDHQDRFKNEAITTVDSIRITRPSSSDPRFIAL